MSKFKASIILPSGRSLHVRTELFDSNNTFDAREAVQAQYPGARILSVDRIQSEQDKRISREKQQDVSAGAVGLLFVVLAAIWFAPLLAIFGLIGYWEWQVTAAWHIVLRIIVIASSITISALALGFALSRINRVPICALGAAAYSGAALYLKHADIYPAAIDWIWAFTLAAAIGAIGWWSFGSCRDVLVKLVKSNNE
jgi:hypothetical protein